MDSSIINKTITPYIAIHYGQESCIDKQYKRVNII